MARGSSVSKFKRNNATKQPIKRKDSIKSIKEDVPPPAPQKEAVKQVPAPQKEVPVEQIVAQFQKFQSFKQAVEWINFFTKNQRMAQVYKFKMYLAAVIQRGIDIRDKILRDADTQATADKQKAAGIKLSYREKFLQGGKTQTQKGAEKHLEVDKNSILAQCINDFGAFQPSEELDPKSKPTKDDYIIHFVFGILKEMSTRTDLNIPTVIARDILLHIITQVKTNNIKINVPRHQKWAMELFPIIRANLIPNFIKVFELTTLVSEQMLFDMTKKRIDMKQWSDAAQLIIKYKFHKKFDIKSIAFELANQDLLQVAKELIGDYPDMKVDLVKYLSQNNDVKKALKLIKDYKLNIDDFPKAQTLTMKKCARYYLYYHLKFEPNEPEYMALPQIEDMFSGYGTLMRALVEDLLHFGLTVEAKGISQRHRVFESLQDWTKNLIREVDYDEKEDTSLRQKDKLGPLSEPESDYMKLPDNIEIEWIDDENDVPKLWSLLDEELIGVFQEWRAIISQFYQQFPTVYQIAGQSAVYMIDLSKLGKSKVLNDMMTKIFTNPRTTIIGFDYKSQFNRFTDRLPKLDFVRYAKNFIDAQELHYLVYSMQRRTGMPQIVEQIFKKKLCQSELLSNWTRRPLRDSQKHFAALDAQVLIGIIKHLIDKGGKEQYSNCVKVFDRRKNYQRKADPEANYVKQQTLFYPPGQGPNLSQQTQLNANAPDWQKKQFPNGQENMIQQQQNVAQMYQNMAQMMMQQNAAGMNSFGQNNENFNQLQGSPYEGMNNQQQQQQFNPYKPQQQQQFGQQQFGQIPMSPNYNQFQQQQQNQLFQQQQQFINQQNMLNQQQQALNQLNQAQQQAFNAYGQQQPPYNPYMPQQAAFNPYNPQQQMPIGAFNQIQAAFQQQQQALKQLQQQQEELQQGNPYLPQQQQYLRGSQTVYPLQPDPNNLRNQQTQQFNQFQQQQKQKQFTVPNIQQQTNQQQIPYKQQEEQETGDTEKIGKVLKTRQKDDSSIPIVQASEAAQKLFGSKTAEEPEAQQPQEAVVPEQPEGSDEISQICLKYEVTIQNTDSTPEDVADSFVEIIKIILEYINVNRHIAETLLYKLNYFSYELFGHFNNAPALNTLSKKIKEIEIDKEPIQEKGEEDKVEFKQFYKDINEDANQVQPDNDFAQNILDAALVCINNGYDSNQQRSVFLVDQNKKFSSQYIELLKSKIGDFTIGFESEYEDNAPKVKQELDNYDKEYDRTNGESLLQIQDRIRLTAYFESVDDFKQAYYNLIGDQHKGCITRIKPEIDDQQFKIIMNMGAAEDSNEGKFLPIIGELHLLYDPQTTNIDVDTMHDTFKKATDIRQIIKIIRTLNEEIKQDDGEEKEEEGQEEEKEEQAEIAEEEPEVEDEGPPQFVDEILEALENKSFNPLEKNDTNVLRSGLIMRIKGQLKSQSKFQPADGINPPLLILVSGTAICGKSCLATFLTEQIRPPTSEYEDHKVRLISTDQVQEIMKEYFSKDEEPLLYDEVYNCGEHLRDKEKSQNQSDVLTGYLRQSYKMLPYLELIIKKMMDEKITLVLEGSQLNPNFILKMMKTYGQHCLSYVISNTDANMHMERVKNRTKAMNPQRSDVATIYAKIAEIQDHILQKAYSYNQNTKRNKQPDQVQNYINIINNINFGKAMRNINQAFQERIEWTNGEDIELKPLPVFNVNWGEGVENVSSIHDAANDIEMDFMKAKQARQEQQAIPTPKAAPNRRQSAWHRKGTAKKAEL